MEKLFNQLGSLVRSEASDIAGRAENLRQDFRADAIAKGEDPAQVDIAIARLESNGVFRAVAEVGRQDAREREGFRPTSARLDESATQLVNAATRATTAANISPGAGVPPSGTDAAPPPPEDTTIIVTACRVRICEGNSGLPSLVHSGLAAVGGAYNGSSSITQRIISGGIGVLSDGPVGYVVGEVVGGIATRVAPSAVQALGGLVNSLFVTGDSYLQSREYSPVRGENDRQDNSNRTPDAVTGTGLVVSALPIIAVIRRLTPSSVPDAPHVDVPDVTPPTTAGGTANAATAPQLARQLEAQNLANIAAQDARLANALRGSVTSNPNFRIGTGTAADADRLGRIFVGDGARPTSNGGLISADGTRVYRPPAPKSSPQRFNPTGVQANFEVLTINPITGRSSVLSNGHLVIRR